MPDFSQILQPVQDHLKSSVLFDKDDSDRKVSRAFIHSLIHLELCALYEEHAMEEREYFENEEFMQRLSDYLKGQMGDHTKRSRLDMIRWIAAFEQMADLLKNEIADEQYNPNPYGDQDEDTGREYNPSSDPDNESRYFGDNHGH